MPNPKVKLKAVRVHLDTTTFDIKVSQPMYAEDVAVAAIKDGVWIENRLYPPNRIVFVELVDVEV